MEQLKEQLLSEGRTIQTVANYLQQAINDQWQQVFQQDLEEFQRIFATSGDPAYAAYSRALFGPIEAQLKEFGLRCGNGLPGVFAHSIERWGPPEERERRFWTAVWPEQGELLGTIITRYFHDHTQLRIPQAPIVLAVEETDLEAVRQKVLHLE